MQIFIDLRRKLSFQLSLCNMWSNCAIKVIVFCFGVILTYLWHYEMPKSVQSDLSQLLSKLALLHMKSPPFPLKKYESCPILLNSSSETPPREI